MQLEQHLHAHLEHARDHSPCIYGLMQPGQRGYPLRPELIESTYWLYKATRDPMYG